MGIRRFTRSLGINQVGYKAVTHGKKSMAYELEAAMYDKYVPIVCNRKEDGTHQYKIYLTKEIAEPFHYDELCTMLSSCMPGDTVEMHLTTPGGWLDTANRIISHLLDTEAETTAVICGEAASAGTMITLACDNAIISNHSTFMIHFYSGGVGGKGHEIKASANHYNDVYPKWYKECYRGFLTPKEINKVIKGKDYYFDAEQFLDRWKNVLAMRDAELSTLQQENEARNLSALLQAVDSAGYKVKPKKKAKK